MNANTEKSVEAPWKAVSFSCGGWLQFYLFGVARAMQERGLDKNIKVSGCSAGSLAAAGLALGGDFDKAVEQCKHDCVPSARTTFMGMFDIPRYLMDSCRIGDFLHRWSRLKDGDLQIAVTKLPYLEKTRVMNYSSEEDLMTSLLASCAIFPLARLVYFRDSWHIDGGLTDFVPDVKGVSPEDTVSISPFHISYCDIKPSRYIPFWWALIPPNSPETIEWIYALGYEDGLTYINMRMGTETPPAPKPKPENRVSTRSQSSKLEAHTADDAPGHDVSYKYADRELSTCGHPYYAERGNVSVRRFMGYRMFPFVWLEMTVDALLMVMLVVVWKPLILVLIYLELLIKAVVLTISTMVTELQETVSPVTMVLAVVFMLPQYFFLATATLSMYARKLLLLGPASCNMGRYDMLLKCLLCIGSLSLLLKFVPSGRPTLHTAPVNKHLILDEVSFLYRLFKHVL